jgi:predicted Zn-dependent protease
MNNLAVALVKGNIDRDRGIELIGEAVAMAPKDGRLRLSYGDALLNAGRPADALVELTKAREILGDRPHLLRLIRRAAREQ